MKIVVHATLTACLLASAMFAQVNVGHGEGQPDLSPLVRGNQSSVMISVNDWGARDDGHTDNTSVLNQGIAAAAAAHSGATIFFPCNGSGTYNVSGPIQFASGLTYRGGGASDKCRLNSTAGGGNYAFSFIGASYTSIYDLSFYAANSQNPPKTVVALGRTPGNPKITAADHYWQRIHVGGYATQAMVYINAAESLVWLMPVIHQNGGGAAYGLYISDSDDLNIYGGPSQQSNTFLNFYGLAILNAQNPSTFAANTWEAVHIGGQATGDIHFTGGGYIAMPGDGGPQPYGTAFGIRPSGRNTMQGPILIDGFRVENSSYFLQAEANTIRGLRVWGNNQATSPGAATAFIFVPPGVTLTNANIQSNACQNGTKCPGNLFAGNVVNSYVIEPDMAISMSGAAKNSQIFSKAGNLSKQ